MSAARTIQFTLNGESVAKGRSLFKDRLDEIGAKGEIGSEALTPVVVATPRSTT